MLDILITDGHQRKTLSAIRSLGRKGLKTACCEVTWMNPAGFSRYCNRFFLARSASCREKAEPLYLLEIVKETGCKVIMPMDDVTTSAVIDNAEEFAKYCRYALPQASSYDIARDKAKAYIHASESGLNCPKTAPAIKADDAYPDISGMKFPLIIKPRESSGSRGMRIAEDETGFRAIYDYVSSIHPCPVVQEYIAISSKIDVCLMYNAKSELKASFIQRELRNYPHPLGPSTVQESISDAGALEMALRFMEGLEWTGPAEIEFITDAVTGEYVFMEINPRFWASLELAVRCGVDFPYMYHQIASEGDCPAVDGYITGVKTQWFFPGDILAFLERRKRKNDPLPYFFTRKYGIINDTCDPGDPMPSFGLFLSAVYHMINKKRRDSILRR